MDPVAMELQWWAEGEYAEVVKQAKRVWGEQWSKKKARAVVNSLIADYHVKTGNQLWRPTTPQERNTLRWAIRSNRSLDDDIN